MKIPICTKSGGEMELTEKMKVALVEVGFGVRKYADGFRGEDTHEKIDGRSLQALFRRHLISWHISGGFSPQIFIDLTPAGEKLFEELRYDKKYARKDW